MSTSIQRFPAGLLELIGARSQGLNPDKLAEQVHGTIELSQFFGIPEQAEARDTIVQGTEVLIEVPADQYWVVFGASLAVAPDGVATGVLGSIGISVTRSLPPTIRLAHGFMPTDAGPTPTATGITLCVWQPPYPLVVPPQTAFWGSSELVRSTPSLEFTLAMRYARLT